MCLGIIIVISFLLNFLSFLCNFPKKISSLLCVLAAHQILKFLNLFFKTLLSIFLDFFLHNI